jgi:hypothetical protein
MKIHGNKTAPRFSRHPQKMDDSKRAGARTSMILNAKPGFVEKIMLEKDPEWNRL